MSGLDERSGSHSMEGGSGVRDERREKAFGAYVPDCPVRLVVAPRRDTRSMQYGQPSNKGGEVALGARDTARCSDNLWQPSALE